MSRLSREKRDKKTNRMYNVDSLSSHTLQFLITEHLLVEFLLHPVKEVGAALVFPPLDVDIETIAVFGFNTEYLVKKRSELFQRHIAVVDTAHFVDAVNQFYEINGVARPLPVSYTHLTLPTTPYV